MSIVKTFKTDLRPLILQEKAKPILYVRFSDISFFSKSLFNQTVIRLKSLSKNDWFIETFEKICLIINLDEVDFSYFSSFMKDMNEVKNISWRFLVSSNVMKIVDLFSLIRSCNSYRLIQVQLPLAQEKELFFISRKLLSLRVALEYKIIIHPSQFERLPALWVKCKNIDDDLRYKRKPNITWDIPLAISRDTTSYLPSLKKSLSYIATSEIEHFHRNRYFIFPWFFSLPRKGCYHKYLVTSSPDGISFGCPVRENINLSYDISFKDMVQHLQFMCNVREEILKKECFSCMASYCSFCFLQKQDPNICSYYHWIGLYDRAMKNIIMGTKNMLSKLPPTEC